jgi:hypothetical protein
VHLDWVPSQDRTRTRRFRWPPARANQQASGLLIPAMHGCRLGDNYEMNRTRSASECATCKQAPKEDESGRLTCACGALWVLRWGIKGTPEEEALLEQSGCRVTQDIQGNVYYVGPAGHIIYLRL